MNRWAGILVPLLAAAIVGLRFADFWMPYGAPYFLLAVNFIFTTLVALAVSFMFGRGFLAHGAPGFLLLGCGAVIWGISGVSSHIAFLATFVFNANNYITIRNLCIWEASLCYFGGAASLLQWRSPLTKRVWWLVGAYAFAACIAGFTMFAAISGLTPTFFVEGVGGTQVRNLALISAIVMLLLTIRMLHMAVGSHLSSFLRWYTRSLFLLALGTAGLIVATVFSGMTAWISQSIQYISSFCMFMAALAVYNKEGNKQIEALAQMHSDARYSYSFALVLVFFAAVLRLVFLPALGVLAIFVTFFPAVMLASLYGGFSAGFLATSATALIVDYLWFEPIGSLRINNFQERAALAIFLVVGTVMAWISHILREKNVRLRSIEAARREDLERLVAERTSELSKEIRVRRQIEAALIAALDESGRSKAELAAILDIAPVAIRIARDACCNIVKDNKTASDLLRSPRQSENCTQQFCGFPFRVVDEFMEEIPASHLPLDRATKGEQVKGDEFNLLFEDGTLRRCTSNAEPLRDEHGTVIGAVAIYLDITERKRAEESLRKSQARLETFVRDAPVSMAMFDRNMNYLAHSDRWIGSGHASLVGRNHFEVFPDLPDAWKRSYQQSLAGASLRNDESFWVRDDGKNEWLRRSVVPWTDENGKIGGIIVFTEDITERKNAIENLRESEARTRLLEKTLMQAVIYRDRDGKIIRANPAAEMILGRSVAELKNTSPEELFGQHLREDGSPFSPDEQPFATALRSGKIVSKVVMGIFNPRKSAYRWVSVDAIPLFRSGEDIPYEVYTVSTDITEAVETNKALAAAKAEAERANLGKSRFLAAASHDLRQPVQSLALLLSALDRHVVKRPHAAKTMDMMKSAVDGLSGLLNGILDISRLDADMVVPEMKGVDVGELVGDLAREYAPAAANKGLSLRSCHHASPAWTDPGLLERVLRNLIENALRYTTEGGILLGLRKRGNRIRIDVIDSGIGIACDSQTKIFEEFYQANVSAHEGRQGMGLGLSIVARIARLLNAEVHVVSELGRGSRFSVLLPFADNVCVKATDLPSELIDPGGRILVIEDNAVLREGFKLVLEAWGYEVLTAACDKDAIDIALRENWQLDAIVTDYQLGRGLTGIATAKEIERRARRTFPTIVITGDTAADRIAEAHAIVLHKPVRAEDLRCSLAQILETEMVRIVSGA